MTVSTTIKQRVQEKINEGIALAEKMYGIKIKQPHVVYNKRGTTAGTANYRTWTIDLNAGLLNEHTDAFIARTVPHELAHLITDQMYPESHKQELVWTGKGYKRTKREVHGANWQSVMQVLGVADSTRCHSYDVSNVKIHKTTTRYEAQCTCCNKAITVGPKVHAKLLKGAEYGHKGCRGSRLKVTGNKIVRAPAVVTSAPAKMPSAPQAGTKLDRCMKIYQSHSASYSRQQMIQAFVQLCECTPAGAATYYATCKARNGA